jgi:formate dehydrogenase iron-sulfur subunit
MDRRIFLKSLGVMGGSALTSRSVKAGPVITLEEHVGMLADTTRCLGCRVCEVSCAQAHGLPEPDLSDASIFDKPRTPTESQWTVVNRYETNAGVIFAKRQCMHCLQPACTAACPTKAMYKTSEGPVIWRGNKCMGCRYCMVSCPFDIPKFEYDKAVPKIQKCILCWDRLQEGKQPACAENCPAGALRFDKRSDLIETARKRIYSEPDKYFHQIYGEQEVGGTGWLYLSAVPFEQIGFRTDLGTTPYPEYTRQFLYGVPVVLILWPAMLLALHKSTESE